MASAPPRLLAALTLALERLEANLLSGLANDREAIDVLREALALARGACLPGSFATDWVMRDGRTAAICCKGMKHWTDV